MSEIENEGGIFRIEVAAMEMLDAVRMFYGAHTAYVIWCATEREAMFAGEHCITASRLGPIANAFVHREMFPPK